MEKYWQALFFDTTHSWHFSIKPIKIINLVVQITWILWDPLQSFCISLYVVTFYCLLVCIYSKEPIGALRKLLAPIRPHRCYMQPHMCDFNHVMNGQYQRIPSVNIFQWFNIFYYILISSFIIMSRSFRFKCNFNKILLV